MMFPVPSIRTRTPGRTVKLTQLKDSGFLSRDCKCVL